MSARARVWPVLAAIAVWLVVSSSAAPAAAGDGLQPLLTARFGNIDAIDAEDGDLAVFLKSIRNDGRYIAPMRTLVGPAIRNPTFFGLTYEAWIEAVLLSPSSPGPLRLVWVFPVDNRDEYMTQLANMGLAEYEGMDGVTVLREMDQDANVHTWYLEWLPGNVAVFGAKREAVAAARLTYVENRASRGLLAGTGGEYMNPDLTVRLDLSLLSTWQNAEPGSYWWREAVGRLARDLTAFWQPSPARQRLLDELTEEFVLWPRSVTRLDASVWFERDGIEWRLDAAGNFAAASTGGLEILRRMPDNAALAYAVPLGEAAFSTLAATARRLLLGGAGGVVTAEASAAAADLFRTLAAAGPRQAAAAWVPPPHDRPGLGAARLLLADWERAEDLDAAWSLIREAVRPGGAAAQAFSQLGWEVEVAEDELDTGAVQLTIRPAVVPAGERVEPYYDGSIVVRRQGGMTALVFGRSRPDGAEMRLVTAHRASIATQALERNDDGSADVRQAFTRVGAEGASVAGFADPVRFLQLALLEVADWRPRSLDEPWPLSTQLAREMLEHASAGAWTLAGEGTAGAWRLRGGLPWQSLARLSGALGITESIGME